MSERSDYKDISLPNFKAFPDLIPGIGAITYLHRSQKASGETVAESVRITLSPGNISTMGTRDWDRPSDWKAFLRQQTMAARNVGFAFYHTAPILAVPLLTKLI